MAEWSNAAVLKTVEAQVSGGSNPSPSAFIFLYDIRSSKIFWGFSFLNNLHISTFVALLNSTNNKIIA